MEANITNMLKLNELKGKKIKVDTNDKNYFITLEETNITLKNNIVVLVEED
jgi:hypothetical protein